MERKRPVILALPYLEHLSPTCGTHTLSRWPPILESYGSGIFHFPFGTAFHTVSLHLITPFLYLKIVHGVYRYTTIIIRAGCHAMRDLTADMTLCFVE